MSKIQIIKDLIIFVEKHPFGSIVIVLILGLIWLISYKKFKVVQLCFNGITSHIRFIKKKNVIFANFSKKSEPISDILKDYVELGYCKYELDSMSKFNEDGTINEQELKKIITLNRNKMLEAIKRIKTKDSFIYLGFPHIPLGFFNGYLFTDTKNVTLFEYNGSNKETKSKGFFELEKIYNSSINIIDTTSTIDKWEEEVALKIEQSFRIDDKKINELLGDIKIIKLGLNSKKTWGITNYAQIDLYQKKFLKLLKLLNKNDVKKVHIFATTPATLSFSLGRIINHYHPDVIVYNYNNNNYDWSLDLKNNKIEIYN